MPNTTLDGLGTFNDDSTCGGEVASAVFNGSASLLSAGTVTNTATFNGNSTLGGTVGTAVVNNTASILASGVVTGDATVTGGTVSGTIQGNATVSGSATITSSGVISGNAQVSGSATVAGTISGDLVLTGSATVASTAVIVGAIQAETPANVDAGATVTGGTTQLVDWQLDSSSKHRLVTANGTVTQSDEGSGVKAAAFSGGKFTTDLTAIGTDDYTFETFVKLDSGSAGYRGNGIADFRSANNSANAMVYFGGAGAYKDLSLYAGGQQNMTTAITDSVWHHVAVTRSSGTSRMYIDGVKMGETSTSYNITNNSIIIGAGISNAELDELHGKLAGYRIVKGTALYTGSTYTIPTALPTNVSGTELLLNFGATAVPTVTDPNPLADAWGATNNGQYNSSGRWYYGGNYVGGESAYNNAVAAAYIVAANAWGVNNSGQYETSGRWYYDGSYVGDEAAYNAAVAAAYIVAANAWGVNNSGQYETSGRWYYGGSYVGDETAYNLTLADAWGVNNNGQYLSSGRWYYGGNYVGDETAYNLTLANAWGVNNSGQYLSSGRWYFGGSYVGDETAYNNAVAIADANAWGVINNGQYQSSGRWYYGGVYLAGGESAYNAAVLIAAANAWGATNDGQYQSSGRWYCNGTYIGDEAAYQSSACY